MNVEINGLDLFIVPFVGVLAAYHSWVWVFAWPVIFASWFIQPRWSKAEGWRFLR